VPAIDDCQVQIIRAMQKAGWTVSPKPYVLRLDRKYRLHIDLEAQNDDKHIVLIEVKCFSDTKAETVDLYHALGQYLIYRSLLKQQNLELELFLAVPNHAYRSVFARMGMPSIEENDVKIIVVDIEREEILEWRR
jgi:hypothetical protein